MEGAGEGEEHEEGKGGRRQIAPLPGRTLRTGPGHVSEMEREC